MNDKPSFFERVQKEHDNAFEEDLKKTEFKTSALSALAWAAVSEGEVAAGHHQRAIAYAILELARVSNKPTPRK